MSSPAIITHVDGVREVFREVRKFEPKLVYKTQARMRRAGQPIVTSAKSLIGMAAASSVYVGGGGSAPTSGWSSNGRLGWQTESVKKGVSIRAGMRYEKSAHRWALLSVHQSSPAGMLYDWAGRSGRYIDRGRNPKPPRGQAFVDALPRLGYIKGSKYSRTIFPAIVQNRGVVARNYVAELEKTCREIQERIAG